jgi:hypothetical protein
MRIGEREMLMQVQVSLFACAHVIMLRSQPSGQRCFA